jgi:hypothetical protein
LSKNREYQEAWRNANPERAREISKGSRQRAKRWAADPEAAALADQAQMLNKRLHNGG